MPRGRDRLRDYLMRRDMARGRDMRNPYGSAGGYITRNRPRRDRGMDYDYAGRDYCGGDYEYDMARGDRAYYEQDSARGRSDYEQYGQYDMAYNSVDMRGRRRNSRGQFMSDRAYDGGYPFEVMGYYDMDGDMARGRGRGRDYGYDYAGGDYGETLTKEELEHWRKKLDREVGDEQSKQFFKKENIEMKAKQMGIEMKKFNAEELAIASYMVYSDYCKSIKPYVGQNMDIYVKMGAEFLNDPDSAVKGGEKLALYFELVSGEED